MTIAGHNPFRVAINDLHRAGVTPSLGVAEYGSSGLSYATPSGFVV
jgi:hypothetical protein